MKNKLIEHVLLEWFLGLVSGENFFSTVFCCQSTENFQLSFYARPTSVVLVKTKDSVNHGHLLVSARINFPEGFFVEIPAHPDVNEEQRAVLCYLRTPRRFCFGLLPAKRESATISVV